MKWFIDASFIQSKTTICHFKDKSNPLLWPLVGSLIGLIIYMYVTS